jgi:SpoVK/Ycf46/Vps4 family AAA+-type ATPase
MKPPDAGARARLLATHTRDLPPELANYEGQPVLEATEGFTGADIKRLVEDTKALYAFDRKTDRAARTATEYFSEAAGAVRENKQRYDEAEAAARPRVRGGRNYYPYFPETDED